MIKRAEVIKAQKRALDMLKKAGIAVTNEEKRRIVVAEVGYGMLDTIGLEMLEYVNTGRVCSRELIQFPGQTCPEHRHPPAAGGPGKEETFRCRYGKIFLYVPGKKTANPKAKVRRELRKYFTVWHEVILNPGEQYTLMPDTLHWFQAGSKGAIMSEFSTTSVDRADIFTDPNIKVILEVED